MSVTTTAAPRSGPAIRALLRQWSPEELISFETQFHQALAEAAETFDVGPVDVVLERWRRIAIVAANPLSDAEYELLQRCRTGDDTGLREQSEDGSFHRIG